MENVKDIQVLKNGETLEATAKPDAEAAPESAEQENVIVLSKPYRFEEKDYTEIDLRGLEKLKIQDAIDTQREMLMKQEAAAFAFGGKTTAFARAIAAKATGLPVEFFMMAPIGVSKRVVAAIRSWLNGTEQETINHILRLEEPYSFDGKQYEQINLSGIAELNSMNESAAENRLAMEGFVVAENTMNYLYACVLASMATKLPEEFFTGLPLRELTKLTNAVNDADFFA